MSSIITLTYESKSEIVSPANVGTEQVLEIEASVFNPLTHRKHKRQSRSHNQRRRYTFTFGRTQHGQIVVPYIAPTDLDQWNEFFDSVSEDEVFEIDATGLPGLDSVFDAVLTGSDFGVERIDILDAYKASFSFERDLN